MTDQNAELTEVEVEAACRALHPGTMTTMGWDDYHEGVRVRCRQQMRLALAAAARARFCPCVVQWDEVGATEIVLGDTLIIWQPWGPYQGHAVDLGYGEDGRLIGIRVWDRVAERGKVVR